MSWLRLRVAVILPVRANGALMLVKRVDPVQPGCGRSRRVPPRRVCFPEGEKPMQPPLPIRHDADPQNRRPAGRPWPRAPLRLQERWRKLQASVDLAESVFAECDRAAVAPGTRLR
ncbi:hypothetical protein GTW51_07330 [Aurantimonas aggregata]|uniref:Uncharacterized protein n=1 Tax=Aurantimonas aggregata TaxID=2047720 RepID=A0A6L9MG18_9HYPH|nr:hypothetical protein [Aurantimonas aggregata]NDV86510.1 hypothetical protein [Aurantimonas aggregata]